MDRKRIKIKKLPSENCNNIFLIGYMGTGKTTTAMKLSEYLRIPFLDLDKEIEDYCGQSISEIFDDSGEEGFRAIETLILLTSIDEQSREKAVGSMFISGSGTIFSCGGGTALSEINITAMKNTGKVVLLTADPETIYERISNDESRPLARGKTIDDIREMMIIREPFYLDAADIIIDTNKKNPADVAGEIVMALGLIPSVS